MQRMLLAASTLALAAALAGCNETTGSLAAPPSAAAPRTPVTPASFRMPEGAGCTGDINRYQAVLKNDVDSGNVNTSVYDQIQLEVAQAASVCATGHDSEAQVLVRASKVKHGYRT